MSISEQYRLAAKDWVDKQAAAQMLEECKTAELAQRVSMLPSEWSMSKKEHTVKATEEWREWIRGMVDARKAANLAKVKLEFLRMKFQEQQGEEATARAEMKMQ